MNVFLYMPGAPEGRERVLGAVAPLVSQGSIEVFQGFAGFAERLRKPKDKLSMAILVGPTKDDIKSLITLRDYFNETKTLFVLPDGDEELLFLAHRAFATFITYIDSPVSDLTGVVKRLIESRQIC